MELLIILVLVVLNGIFSMSETAVLTARKARLQQLAEKGNKGAQTALKLAEEPNRFLSTVQVGITLIGVLTGAFGGATLAHPIALLLVDTPLAPYADAIGFTVIVALTTYLSLIIGELVPKRLALRAPELVARRVARPMHALSLITAPLVTLLSLSTDAILWLIGARKLEEPPVTQHEIEGMVKQGVDAGVFEETAHEMVQGVFSLNDRNITTIMTPRHDVVWIDVQDTEATTRNKIISSHHSRLPVCDGDLDHVLGIVYAKDLLERFLKGKSFDLRQAMTPEVSVPGNVTVSKLIDTFRESGSQIAMVVGEYGDTLGVVSMHDVLKEIVGDVEHADEHEVMRREDGSYLLGGLISIAEFANLFKLDVNDIPGAHKVFETLGGFVMAQVDNIPKAGDHFTWGKLRVEVMDMDGNRVDKVLVSTLEEAPKDATNG